jgi:hypothetical protein
MNCFTEFRVIDYQVSLMLSYPVGLLLPVRHCLLFKYEKLRKNKKKKTRRVMACFVFGTAGVFGGRGGRWECVYVDVLVGFAGGGWSIVVEAEVEAEADIDERTTESYE